MIHNISQKRKKETLKYAAEYANSFVKCAFCDFIQMYSFIIIHKSLAASKKASFMCVYMCGCVHTFKYHKIIIKTVVTSG